MALKLKQKSEDILKINEKKWSKALMDPGWTAFPSVILENLDELGLKPIDATILMYLSTHWWTADNLPRPSKFSIAKAVGIQSRSVQRRIANLEKKGLIKRVEHRIPGKGSRPNSYSFAGLIKAAIPLASKKAEEIAQRRAIAAAKKLTQRPKLTLVKK